VFCSLTRAENIGNKKQTTKGNNVITKLFRLMGLYEVCFYIESLRQLTLEELSKLHDLIAETFEPSLTKEQSSFSDDAVVEIGPRLSVETPFSTNAVAICHAMGLDHVTRIERSTRYPLEGTTREEILKEHLDVMTQGVYPLGGITTFDSGILPEEVQTIPILEEGAQALHNANKNLGLGMDDWDVEHYTKLFQDLGRNPTDVEIFQIGNANSEHSRHWAFKGKLVIDGKEMPECLLDMIQAPLEAISYENDVTILAFNDNVGALWGHDVHVLKPSTPGSPSRFKLDIRTMHQTATAETHNHPTLIAPYAGAATKIGGRIRDTCAGGQGSLIGFGVAGYCVGNLFVPKYEISGEVVGGEVCETHATPLRILLEGSDGDFEYGNQFGEPTIGGFTRTFCQQVSGERREFRKPVFYGSGIGHIDGVHTKKKAPVEEMLIVAIGGPAYAIGVGGGAASSMNQGENSAALDFNSVQRGNGEMGNKVARVIRACVEMGDTNPIESIHDQGAGGPSNVLTELMDPSGGKIDIRKIVLGDKTMSTLSIWSGEYQERYGLLIYPQRIESFQRICERERVNCEIVGEITGDGHVTVIDSQNGTTPVHLNLENILGKLPQKTFHTSRVSKKLKPAELPDDLTLERAAQIVLQQLSVGSKGFLTRKVDRSVGGRVVQQQCCGAHQIPIADVQVLADGFYNITGVASALGEQPLKMLIDSAAGARMSMGEMFTNLMSVGGIDMSEVRCRVNWMWPAKMPGERALLYDAVEATRDAMLSLWMACDGGKDSLSMVATVNGESVKAPGEVVVFGYASIPNIEKVVTPDIKNPGASYLGLIDLGFGKNRLGGSAILQALNQLGDETPDCDLKALRATWRAIQKLHALGCMLSIHDRSDGGLFATVVEMCLGGNCGLMNDLEFDIKSLFSEELGLVIEYNPVNEGLIKQVLEEEGAPSLKRLGRTSKSAAPRVFGIDLITLREWWELTSYNLERLQTQNGVADEEFASYKSLAQEPVYKLSFIPTIVKIQEGDYRPKVAIWREEGSNGDREMAAAFFTAGCDPYDISTSDLLAGRITLDDFQILVAVGGFSFMDVFDSAKGWACTVEHNKTLNDMIKRFRYRRNTCFLGVCNGCQFAALLGLVPFGGEARTLQPRFVHNLSGRFESRWSQVKIQKSPSIMLRGMEGSTLGVWNAHGEGRLIFPEPKVLDEVCRQNLAPIVYVDSSNEATEKYPFNPNGSVDGIGALCSPDGRYLAMMSHPERCFLKWQWPYMPETWKRTLKASPWLKMFENARDWCLENREP